MTDTAVKQDLIRRAKLRLASGLIRVELKPEHENEALQLALDRYRQRASNSSIEQEIFIDFVTGQQEYKLPENVKFIRQIWRRGVSGTSTGTGANLDPFVMQQINTNLQLAGTGGLATYDFFMQYQEVVGRLFGRNIDWIFDKTSKVMTIIRNIVGTETVMVEVELERTDEDLILDPYAKLWLLNCTVAYMKLILGEAYQKFGNLAGPNGGVTLKGAELKTEAQAMLDKLDEELMNSVTDDRGYEFIIQ